MAGHAAIFAAAGRRPARPRATSAADTTPPTSASERRRIRPRASRGRGCAPKCRRGQREAQVQPRIPCRRRARWRRRRGALDQHVARRAGRPVPKPASAANRRRQQARQRPGWRGTAAAPRRAGRHRWCSRRSPRAARKPPTTMPAAPHSMKPVTTKEVTASGRSCSSPQRRPAKLCIAAERAQVDQKKNETQPHRGQAQEGSGCSASRRPRLGAPGMASATERSSMAWRLSSIVAARSAPTAGAARGPAPRAGGRGDGRHEHRRRSPAEVARDAVHREGMAQARLRDALVEDGEVHRVEGQLPGPPALTPASARRSPCAGRRQRRDEAGQAANSTGRAPTRSTRKPASAWPMPEIDEEGADQQAELG